LIFFGVTMVFFGLPHYNKNLTNVTFLGCLLPLFMPDTGPYLSADALTHILVERAPDVVDGKTFQTVRGFWEEWTYAWEHR
jgi:hypothetical protein